MIKRRMSRSIQVGGVTVGGHAPVNVQSMTKTDTRDVTMTINQIAELADAGCEIVRIAVPDHEAAEAIVDIKRGSPIPVIADIHFDHRLALSSIENGADQVRFNPGNIGNPENVASIVKTARERSIPLRIGVNAGSLKHERRSDILAQQMAEAVMDQIRLLEDLDFDLIEVSLKASDVLTTIEANRLVADKMPYPLHIGVTEAGLPGSGSIYSAAGLGPLLYLGIGDSLRVSLTTAEPSLEVYAGYEILKSLEIRRESPRLISCPTCGRCEANNFYDLVHQVEQELLKLRGQLTVAVMGCVVNGPGEAMDADVGLACGKGKGVIFTRGQKIRTVQESEFFIALMAEIRQLKR